MEFVKHTWLEKENQRNFPLDENIKHTFPINVLLNILGTNLSLNITTCVNGVINTKNTF